MTNLGIGFAGKTYMQDVNKTICDGVATGTEGRLIDNRDGKVYWVAKQKDGLCWMTQNLDYDGGGTKSEISSWGSDGTAAKYYDAGAYIYTSPITQNVCSNNSSGLSACTGNGWKKVDEYLLMMPENTWTVTDISSFYGATSYIATDGITICNKEANSYFGDMESDYIPCRIYSADYLNDEELHYLAGNYYSYVAATNNTAPSGSGNAAGSICPTGWNLPTSNNTNTGSFGALTSGLTASTSTTTNNLKLAPYYFVYSGYVDGSSLGGAGSVGHYWSSTAVDDTRAYYLDLSTNIGPSYNFHRYYGYSVRCVAR